jgi:hypothetical protein
MTQSGESRRELEWRSLHDRIDETLDPYGKKDPVGEGDYWLVEDDLGQYRQWLEIQNLELLRPSVIKALQALLVDYPDWEIMFRVDVLGKENEWPAMGLIIHDDEIIDDLRREFLPLPFRSFVYEGAKPLKTIDMDDRRDIFRRALK